MIHLLCQQATISITNALLFRSVQAGTRENLRMIDTQKKALAIARQSREDALKATKVKPFNQLTVDINTINPDKKQLLGVHVSRVGYYGHYSSLYN